MSLRHRSHHSPIPGLMQPVVAIIALALVALVGGCEPVEETPTSCKVGEVVYSPGDSIPSPDGCNSCSCDASGNVACTKMACPDTCDYEGSSYDAGDSFPASDGCNDCSCMEGGQVVCTQKACVTSCEYEGATYNAGQSFPAADGCNSCTCDAGGTVSCTEAACPNPDCVVGDQTYASGESVPSDDPCEACTCKNAAVECLPTPCNPPVCEYDGQQYNVGDTFPASDGCNTCTCGETGDVACTEMACPDTCEPGKIYPAADGCNTCECPESGLKSEAACTEMACGPCDGAACGAECAHPELDCIAYCSADGQCLCDGQELGCEQNGSCTASSECADDEFCDFPNDDCGVWGGSGSCEKRPEATIAGGPGVCGCDGTYMTNSGELHATGIDENTFGGCSKEGGDQFACGDLSCNALTQACHIAANDAIDPANPDNPDFYASCVDLPDACPVDGTATCGCIPAEAFSFCSDASGHIMRYYMGG